MQGTGCGTTRGAAKTTGAQPTADSTAAVADTGRMTRYGAIGPLPDAPGGDGNAAPAASSALAAQLMPLYARELSWNTFSGKAKAHYQGADKDEEFNAVIRMKKDQAIWISIRALGLVEVASGVITPDSVKFINRLQKEAYALPMAEAGKLLPVPVDFATMQRLLIGDVLSKGGQATDAQDVGNGYNLNVLAGDLQQQITWNKADSSLRQQQAAVGAALTMLLQYSDYKNEGGRRFANGRVMHIVNRGDRVMLSLDFNQARFDEEVDVNFSIPSKYKIVAPK